MRDFLDNLIDRHGDVAPQIQPRLPSIFEPGVSHGGLNLAVEEEATTREEIETLRQPPSAAQPVGPPTVAKPVRPSVSPAPTVPVEEEQPSVKASLNGPVLPLSPREIPTLPPPLQGRSEKGVRGLNQEFLKPSTPLITPVIPAMDRPERPISQPEPVINVTIGRIEVRATVSPQKQTPKPESRTPVMGLEEYLRRRSGGQDR
jgi:hypothetical protein